jgi:hypothetical protein
MHKLFKLSAPGWEKEFQTKDELHKELFKHICGICQEGDKAYNNEGELIYESSPVNESSSIDELLCTACGCEFDVEMDIENE